MLFLLNQNKNAVESHLLLDKTHGEGSLPIRTSGTCFRQFKSNDLNGNDSEHSGRVQMSKEDKQVQKQYKISKLKTQGQLQKALIVWQKQSSNDNKQ